MHTSSPASVDDVRAAVAELARGSPDLFTATVAGELLQAVAEQQQRHEAAEAARARARQAEDAARVARLRVQDLLGALSAPDASGDVPELPAYALPLLDHCGDLRAGARLGEHLRGLHDWFDDFGLEVHHPGAAEDAADGYAGDDCRCRVVVRVDLAPDLADLADLDDSDDPAGEDGEGGAARGLLVAAHRAAVGLDPRGKGQQDATAATADTPGTSGTPEALGAVFRVVLAASGYSHAAEASSSVQLELAFPDPVTTAGATATLSAQLFGPHGTLNLADGGPAVELVGQFLQALAKL